MEETEKFINTKNNFFGSNNTSKVGHLYENVKFECDDEIVNISADFHNEFLKIIKDASHRDYNALNQLIDNTFDADIEVLKNKLQNDKNLLPADKKKLFFDEQTSNFLNEFRDYIKIIYMEHILFDFLNIGLKDLTNNSINEILASKQENRIDNFIASMTNDEARLDNGFKTDYTGCVQDKKNFLRYVIRFNFLAVSCGFVKSKAESLKEISYEKVKDLQDKIEKNNESIKENGDKVNMLNDEIQTLQGQIAAYQKRLNEEDKQLKDDDEKNKNKKEQTLQQKQDETNEIIKQQNEIKSENTRLSNTIQQLNFVLQNYNNELKLAQNILDDIQNSWGSAFENFIFPYMLENPNEIVKLKKDYHFSVWDFVNFLLDNQNNQNFNRALYEIDKAKDSKDFEGKEGDKRTKILQNVQHSINSLDENQCKLVNDLFNNGYSDNLENSWMRKAFWILFAGISLLVVVATAPLLAIALMNLGILLVDVVIFAIPFVIDLIINIIANIFSPGIDMGLPFTELFFDLGCPLISFRSLPIITPYYCSTFFFVAIGITSAFLICAIAFYIYKKCQFNSMIRIPNLQIQQEKPPLEQRLERFKEQSGEQNSPETEKNQNNLDYNASNKRLT